MRAQAFDLLDALSRSGALPLEHAAVHVIVAATHCFERGLMATVVEDNIDPIDRVERSSIAMAAAIHEKPVDQLIAAAHAARLAPR